MPEYAVIDGQRVELTEWFPVGVTPAHMGCYEFQDKPACGAGTFYRYWSGCHWWAIGFSAVGALGEYLRGSKSAPSIMKNEQWRGLAHPPGAT